MKQGSSFEKSVNEMEKFMKFWVGFCAIASVGSILLAGYVVVKLLPAVVHFLESH